MSKHNIFEFKDRDTISGNWGQVFPYRYGIGYYWSLIKGM